MEGPPDDSINRNIIAESGNSDKKKTPAEQAAPAEERAALRRSEKLQPGGLSEIYSQSRKKRLTVKHCCDIILELSRTACGLVAQLDRVFDYESKGRGFESRRAHHERGAEKRLFSLCFNVFKVFGKERRFSDTQINPDEFDQAIGDPLVIMDENEIISLAIPLSFRTGETEIGGVATIPE